MNAPWTPDEEERMAAWCAASVRDPQARDVHMEVWQKKKMAIWRERQRGERSARIDHAVEIAAVVVYSLSLVALVATHHVSAWLLLTAGVAIGQWSARRGK